MGNRRCEAGPVVAGGDLGAVEVRGTWATLLQVLLDRGMAGGGVPLGDSLLGGDPSVRELMERCWLAAQA
jgi:hypothetical protein